MLFQKIAVFSETGELLSDCDIRVENGTISEISKTPLAPKEGETCYNGAGKLLAPAFFNAHAHAPMTLLRGWGENLVLQDWLNTRIFPFEARLTEQDIYLGTQLAIAEMVRGGAVSSTEMYFGGESMARAATEAGVKMNLSVAVTCFDDRSLYDQARFQEQLKLGKEWHNAANGRFRVDLGMHAEYTSNPRIVKEMAEYAKESGLRMQVHLSETKRETDECVERHGKTPARYFYDLGLFDVPTTAAHCVWVTPDDMDLLKEKDVTVASCPASNMKLASGFCNVPLLLEKGVRVALGTDGAASNNSLNMMADMKLLALAAKGAFSDPCVVSPQQAFYAATRAGALSQGREESGVIRVGAAADLQVIRMDTPWWVPSHNAAADLVYAAQSSDVCLTMCDGEILYQDGVYTTLDIERISYEARRAAQRIAKEISA